MDVNLRYLLLWYDKQSIFTLYSFQEDNLLAQDVLWSCQLAHRLGLNELSEFLKVVISNVHSPAVLTQILHRCRGPLPYGPPPHLSIPPQMHQRK